MGAVQYRIAGAGELDAAARVLGRSYRAAYRGLMDDSYLDGLAQDHWAPILYAGYARGDTCVLALEAGELVGAAVFGAGEAPGEADFHAIYLLPGAVGRGVGHGLYAAVEREMDAQGFKRCTLEALCGNSGAVRFYAAHGFKPAGEFTVEEHGMRLACVKMRKYIRKSEECGDET